MSATRPFGGRAAGDIGLAELGEDLGGEARPVVADLDGDVAAVETGRDQHLGAGEIGRVLHEVGHGVDDLRQAAHVRRGTRPSGDHRLDANRTAVVRLDHLVQQLLHAEALVHRVVGGLGRGGQPGQDFAAAHRLGDHQLGVLARVVGGRRPRHLAGDDGDGGQRRAQLVRGGGGEGAQGRQLLLAG